jgi:hypothetical protein
MKNRSESAEQQIVPVRFWRCYSATRGSVAVVVIVTVAEVLLIANSQVFGRVCRSVTPASRRRKARQAERQ